MGTNPTQTRNGTGSIGIIIRGIEGGLTGGETICDGWNGIGCGVFEIVCGIERVGGIALTGSVEASEGGGIVNCWT